MKRSPLPVRRRAVLTLLAALTILVAPLHVHGGLPQDIERVVRSTELGGATVAVSIRDVRSGAELADINADKPLIPASNMKLITTGAALHALGADFRFRTRLLLDGDRLIVVGDGDPAFGDPELLEEMGPEGTPLDIEAFLQLWVRPIRATGVTSVSEVVVDDRIFDRQFVHGTWPRDQLNRRYCAEVSGLSFHANTLHLFPRPRGGERPDLDIMSPRAPWITISNRATSDVSAGSSDTVWIARKFETNEMTVYGNVRHAYRTPVPVTVHDPATLFARILADRLNAAGVSVGAARAVGPDDGAPTGKLVVPEIVTPIGTVVERCNRDSQNLYAECLLKRMGRARTGQPGSWLNGASIVRHVLHERLDAQLAASFVIADGSGLSRDNRIAPRSMTAWLQSLRSDPQLGDIFMASLAVGGETGTLSKRMRSIDLRDAVVQAKSGYINGVSCLSGFVTIPGAGSRCFCIMVNDLGAAVAKAKRMQDEIIEAVAWDLASTVGISVGAE